MEQAWIQVIGFAGTALVLLSFQFRSNRKLFLMQALGCVCFLVHFGLLGAYAGMLLNLFGIIRGYVMVQAEKGKTWANSRGMRILLPLLCLVMSLPSGSEGWLTLLPICGSLVETISQQRKNAKLIRLLKLFFCSPCWLVYNICSHSIPGAVTEIFCMLSVILSIYRFGLKNLGQAQPAEK